MSPTTVRIDEIDDAQLAAAVRAEMARRGRKLADLTAPLGLSYPTVSNRINAYSSFSLAELRKVAEFLGITLAHLLESAELGRRMTAGEPSEVVVEIPPADPWAQPRRAMQRRPKL